MADNTPRHNQNQVNLALLLDDATTGADNGIAASTDGMWATAVKKNYYLHEAYRWIADTIIAKFGIASGSDLLQGLISTQSITFSSSGVNLNKDYLYPVRLYKSATTDSFYLSKRASLDDDFMPWITNFYTLEAGKLYAYQRTAGTLSALNGGTGTLYYIKAERLDSNGADVASNTTPDITLDRRWHDACVLYAASRAALDKGIIDNDPAWQDKANRFFVAAQEKLPK